MVSANQPYYKRDASKKTECTLNHSSTQAHTHTHTCAHPHCHSRMKMKSRCCRCCCCCCCCCRCCHCHCRCCCCCCRQSQRTMGRVVAAHASVQPPLPSSPAARPAQDTQGKQESAAVRPKGQVNMCCACPAHHAPEASFQTSGTVRQQSVLDRPKHHCTAAEHAGPDQGRHRAVSVHTEASLCGSRARWTSPR